MHPSGPEQSIVLLERMGNVALAQLGGRRFPGLLVQGDTLSNLLAALEEECPGASATATLREWIESYERAMALHGQELPYVR